MIRSMAKNNKISIKFLEDYLIFKNFPSAVSGIFYFEREFIRKRSESPEFQRIREDLRKLPILQKICLSFLKYFRRKLFYFILLVQKGLMITSFKN